LSPSRVPYGASRRSRRLRRWITARRAPLATARAAEPAAMGAKRRPIGMPAAPPWRVISRKASTPPTQVAMAATCTEVSSQVVQNGTLEAAWPANPSTAATDPPNRGTASSARRWDEKITGIAAHSSRAAPSWRAATRPNGDAVTSAMELGSSPPRLAACATTDSSAPARRSSIPTPTSRRAAGGGSGARMRTEKTRDPKPAAKPAKCSHREMAWRSTPAADTPPDPVGGGGSTMPWLRRWKLNWNEPRDA